MSLEAWNTLDWFSIKKNVFRMQRRIYKASLNGNRKKMHALQRRLMFSPHARALCVKIVTESNRGRQTWVDKTVIINAEEKLKLAKSLSLDKKASPRVFVKPRANRCGPTIRDRAKQALAKLVLEPEWEAKFEPNSYGFRPGRSCHDAIHALSMVLRGKTRFVLDAKVTDCFDNIHQNKLLKKLNTVGILRDQVAAWLKAGIMIKRGKESEFQYPMMETRVNIISPLLANIALHGLETSVKEFYVQNVYDGPKKLARQDQLRRVSVVRYADNFVITCPAHEHLIKLKSFTENWLQNETGLSLSEEKTTIVNSFNGFEFLGFHMISIRRGEKITFLTRVSRKSKTRFLRTARKIIQKNKAARTARLIDVLAPVITGWCNYFRYCQCTQDFKLVEFSLFGQVRAWVFRRKSKNLSRMKLKLKYFPKGASVVFNGVTHKGDWILRGTKSDRRNQNTDVFLPHPSWITSKNYVKVRGPASPFDGNTIYWAQRLYRFGPFSTLENKMLQRQNNRCVLCQRYLAGSVVEKDHIIPVAAGRTNCYAMTTQQSLLSFCQDENQLSEQKRFT